MGVPCGRRGARPSRSSTLSRAGTSLGEGRPNRLSSQPLRLWSDDVWPRAPSLALANPVPPRLADDPAAELLVPSREEVTGTAPDDQILGMETRKMADGCGREPAFLAFLARICMGISSYEEGNGDGCGEDDGLRVLYFTCCYSQLILLLIARAAFGGPWRFFSLLLTFALFLNYIYTQIRVKYHAASGCNPSDTSRPSLPQQPAYIRAEPCSDLRRMIRAS